MRIAGRNRHFRLRKVSPRYDGLPNLGEHTIDYNLFLCLNIKMLDEGLNDHTLANDVWNMPINDDLIQACIRYVGEDKERFREELLRYYIGPDDDNVRESRFNEHLNLVFGSILQWLNSLLTVDGKTDTNRTFGDLVLTTGNVDVGGLRKLLYFALEQKVSEIEDQHDRDRIINMAANRIRQKIHALIASTGQSSLMSL